MGAINVANEFVQTMADARVDAKSLSGFMSEPSDVLVPRRLAAPINTLDYYLQYLRALELIYSQPVGVVNINGVMVKTVAQAVKDALSAAVVGEGGISATLIATTTETLGQVARSQNNKNNDIVVIEDYGSIGDGTNHPLSERFATLALAKVKYPFVSSLTDSIDWAAAQAAANSAASKGALLTLSGKKYFFNKPVNIDNNVIGNGSVIYTPGSSTFDVFNVLSKNDITAENLRFKKLGVSSGRGYALKLRGASDNFNLINVTSDEYAGVFYADGDDGVFSNAKYRISVSNTASGGTWKIGFYPPVGMGEIKWTGDIAYNATAETLQTALDVALGAGRVIVTGSQMPKNSLTVEFIGEYAGLYVQPPTMRFAYSGAIKSYGGEAKVINEGGTKLATNITLDRVVARDSGEFGIYADNARVLKLINCTSTGSWFDGVKLRKNVKGYQAIGGSFTGNGTSWFADGLINQQTGDGLDGYAGGEQITIIGGDYNGNNGAGIQLKNDDATDLTGFGAGKFGRNSKIQLIGVTASYNRVASGVAITTNKDAANAYSIKDIVITGGTFEGNAVYGISTIGFGVSINAANTSRNGFCGIVVEEGSNFVELNNCISVANGAGTGTGLGLLINGKNVTVNGGTYRGIDSDGITASTDLSTLTKHHLSNIKISGTASDVFINMVEESHNSGGRGIIVEPKNGIYPPNIKIWQRPTEAGLIAGQSLIFGSAGSILYKRDATQAGDQMFIKLTGDSGSVGTWRRVGASTLKQITSSETMTGNDNIILATAVSADTVVTLPPVLNQVGMEYRITKIAGTGFAVKVAPHGVDKINGGAVPASMSANSESILLIGTTTGWRVIDKSVGVTGV